VDEIESTVNRAVPMDMWPPLAMTMGEVPSDFMRVETHTYSKRALYFSLKDRNELLEYFAPYGMDDINVIQHLFANYAEWKKQIWL
jgi:hypothetical protein